MSSITVRGARLHNLKNVSLSIPKNKLVVFTGVSGSGKSTMAFDIAAQGGPAPVHGVAGDGDLRRSKPAVDSISGLSPSISVDQGLTNRSPRSTVGTATEVFTYLRVLFARVGHRPCPRCGRRCRRPRTRAVAKGCGTTRRTELPGLDEAADPGAGGLSGAAPEPGEVRVPCPHCGARLPEMGMAMFSFNKPDGACPTCTGLGTIYAPTWPACWTKTRASSTARWPAGMPPTDHVPRRDAAQRRAPLRLRVRPGAAHPRPGPDPARPAALRRGGPAVPAALPRRGAARHRRQRPLRGHRHHPAAPPRRARQRRRVPGEDRALPDPADLPGLRRRAPAARSARGDRVRAPAGGECERPDSPARGASEQ